MTGREGERERTVKLWSTQKEGNAMRKKSLATEQTEKGNEKKKENNMIKINERCDIPQRNLSQMVEEVASIGGGGGGGNGCVGDLLGLVVHGTRPCVAYGLQHNI